MKHTKWEQNWRFNQELVQALEAQEAIAVECRIAREQADLQAAWDELQNVPSYCEQQAAAFVKEQGNDI